ncbi:MAG: adenosylmethionine decarboxylase [bacterium]|jgi:S-adenosylmethionine decarboxylase
MDALGKHILAEFYDCDHSRINDEKFIEKLFLRVAEEAGATIVNWIFHKFSPQGVSGVVVIAESHLTVHTWPEHGYCAVDIFTCGERIDSWLCLSELELGLRASNTSVVEMNRGILGLGVNRAHSEPLEVAA